MVQPGSSEFAALWRQTELPKIVRALAARGNDGHVRTLLGDILHHGFGADYLAIDHEVRMPEVRGRADALFGATVFEIKKDLRQEIGDARGQLERYLTEREARLHQRFLGIATDGATFVAFELRGGALVEISRHEVRAERPNALLDWLGPAVSRQTDLLPEPLIVQRELGRESLTFARARGVLDQLWAALAAHPEVALKRQLWDGFLREVYATSVGDDSLFLQHTYLTIVAKTVAARVLDVRIDDAEAVLSGRALADIGILGAVESDFFDWVLQSPDGADLVLRIARQTARFRLRDAKVDVLKALYESLVDPAQRHDLGEYYTPDWLAARVVGEAVAAPLTQRILDPACGSGTFLFHGIRRLLAAARAAKWPQRRAVEACVAQVRGIDVHPVAVIFARVTWLLALARDDTIEQRPSELHVPVYLGDSMQWGVSQTGDVRELAVPVPNDRPLHVPAGFAQDQAKFEAGLRVLTDGLRDGDSAESVERALRRIDGVDADSARRMTDTYEHLRTLYRAGRDGIWPYVLRNLRRPLWLSRDDQRADVIVGNPPWVAYRHLSPELKTRLRDASMRMNLWVGGVLATQQDLAALFWARCAERYLKPGGMIAFVLPYAALNRPAFGGLRRGDYRDVSVRITAAWSFDENVRPLFPVPACVLIARRETAGPLPAEVTRCAGTLPRRDASEAEAGKALRWSVEAWPPVPTLLGASPYRARFQDGATIYPRRFFIVERESPGRLGQNPAAPGVRGKTGGQDKKPWRNVDPPHGPVEAAFLRPIVLGETIAPFRLLAPALGVIPAAGGEILDARAAAEAGHRHLASWLRDVEAKWRHHAAKRVDGSTRMTLLQQLDYMRKLSAQAGISSPRIVYAKAGTLFAAAVLNNELALVDHMAYWAPLRSVGEGRYLSAILNSETARKRIAPMQPKGQGGARHFDNLIWELPIPEFDRRDALHAEIAKAAEAAERVAAKVALAEAAYFTSHRRAIRDALIASGVGGRIDDLVTRLLDAPR